MVGGNLAVLNANIGTPFDVDTAGKIVVIEDCDELYFRIDRFMYQASAAGKFAKAKAVLVGTIENIMDGEQHDGSRNLFGVDLSDILRHFIPDHVPVAYGLPLGHGTYLSSHPIGAGVRFDIDDGAVRMKLLAPAVA